MKYLYTLFLLISVMIPSQQVNAGTDPNLNKGLAAGNADLALTITASSSAPKVGDEITVTMEITNNGPDVATNVETQFEYLEAFAFVSASAPVEYDDATKIWSLGSLANGEKRTLTIQLKVVKATSNTRVRATIGKSDQTDPNTGNNYAEAAMAYSYATYYVSSRSNQTCFGKVGDVAQVTFTVTNPGNTTLTIQSRFNKNMGTVYTATLKPMEKKVYSFVYTIEQEDVYAANAGLYLITQATDPSANPVTASFNMGMDMKPCLSASSFSVTYQLLGEVNDKNCFLKAGDPVEYRIIVRNTGSTKLTNVKITDALTGKVQTIPSLTAGLTQSLLPDFFYVVTPADVTAGQITNTATATATDPSNATINATDVLTIPGCEAPGVVISVYTNKQCFSAAGEVIEYTIDVYNEAQKLNNVLVEDVLGGVSHNETLDPYETKIYVKNYTVKPADIALGYIDFIGKVKGTGPAPNLTLVSAQETERLSKCASPAVSIAVKADKDCFTKAGDMIKYSIEVKNTGDELLNQSPLFVADILSGLYQSIPSLAIGETKTIILNYTVTAADLAAGKINNKFTIKATGGAGSDHKKVSAEVTKVISTCANPGIAIIKTTNLDCFAKAGDKIIYTIVVANPSDYSTLLDVVVTDPLTGLNQTLPNILPEKQAQVTTTYTVTPADVLAKKITNTAQVTAKTKSGEFFNLHSATVTKVIELCPQYSIKIAISTAESCFAKLGDEINYTTTVTNTGTGPLTTAMVNTVLGGVYNGGNMAPGAVRTLKDKYIVTQADITAGAISVKADVKASDPFGGPVTDDATNTIKICPLPAVTLTKAADITCFTGAGNHITYTLVVKNTGNVVLTNVKVSDPLTGLNTTIPTLAVSESKTITSVYTVTAADVTAGKVDNTAKVTAGNVTGTDVTAQAMTTVEVCPAPAITLTKTADITCFAKAGDKITYTLTIKNTGNVVLSNAKVSDPLTGFNVTQPSLAPSDSRSFSSVYIVTAADVTAGKIDNTAKVTAENVTGTDVTAQDSKTVEVCPAPAITLTKTADITCFAKAGDKVNYTLTIKNTGNVVLTNVKVTDPLTGFDTTLPSLAVAETKTFNSVYTVAAADVTAGKINNTAKVTAENITGTDVTAQASKTVEVCPAPAITLTKTADITCFAKAGDKITYTLTIKNTGNVVLSNVKVTDPLTSFSVTQPSLAPSDSRTFSSIYTVTSADITAGKINNTAKVTAENVTGTDVTAQASKTVGVCPAPAITLTKVADISCFAKAGDKVSYTLTIKNTGNVVLTSVKTTDPLTGFNTTLPSLAVAETKTFNSIYTVTAADVTAGKISNTAKVTAENVTGTNVTAQASKTIEVCPAPEISIIKEATETLYQRVGDIIHYTITIKNTGNVTLTDVVVTDPLTHLTKTIASLAPGASETISTTYTITKVDMDNGKLLNTASVTGKSPQNTVVNDKADKTIPAKPPFHIPNVFTPDGDGYNDTFKIVGSEEYQIDITIFNRWGAEVYRKTDYKSDWDGYGLNEGTYYYLILAKKDGKVTSFKGWVLLKR